jgi:hypothetical protein
LTAPGKHGEIGEPHRAQGTMRVGEKRERAVLHPAPAYLTNSKGENIVPRAWNRAIVQDEVKQALAECS